MRSCDRRADRVKAPRRCASVQSRLALVVHRSSISRKHRHLHGFAQVVAHTSDQAALAISVAASGHRKDGWAALDRQRLPDPSRGFVAVDVRHVAVHEDGRVARVLRHAHRLATVRGHIRDVAELLQHPHRHALVDGIVFGHEDPSSRRARIPVRESATSAVSGDGCGSIAVGHGRDEREPELRTDPDGACHANRAAEALHQPFGYREAKAGAAEPSRGGGVGLRELLEQQPLLVLGNADASVGHRHAQRDSAALDCVGRPRSRARHQPV